MNIPTSRASKIRFFNSIYKADVTKAALKRGCYNLDRGTKVLINESECIRYIALYGGHHFHKLYAAYESSEMEKAKDKNIEIFDWGCGQALATCVLIDYLIEKDINLNLLSITLIEPSIVALQRGRKLVKKMFQDDSSTDSIVKLVNKSMDDLTSSDLVSVPANIKIHLFSSIIDVEGFNLKRLYQLIVNSFQGINRIICTSPNNLRKRRLETFYDFFLKSHKPTAIFTSTKTIYGDVFYVMSGKYEEREITRCERQFTVKLP
jgi:hypothetical protein